MAPVTDGMWKARLLDVAGQATAVFDQGKGPPVLLIHGSSVAVDARLTWFRTAPALQGHRVIAYDQPGFGLSAMPAGGVYTDREQRAQHALALIDRLDLRGLTVVGHSEGGYIAARLALLRPERIARIVIAASGGTAPRLGGALDKDWMQAATKTYDYLQRTTSEEVFVATEDRLRARKDPEFEALLRENFRYALRSGNVEMFRSKARNKPGYEDYTELSERLVLQHADRLTLPTLLVWGGADATVPVARGEALASRLPQSRLEVLDGAGHWVMHDAQARFNRLITAWAS